MHRHKPSNLLARSWTWNHNKRKLSEASSIHKQTGKLKPTSTAWEWYQSGSVFRRGYIRSAEYKWSWWLCQSGTTTLLPYLQTISDVFVTSEDSEECLQIMTGTIFGKTNQHGQGQVDSRHILWSCDPMNKFTKKPLPSSNTESSSISSSFITTLADKKTGH